mmetsp:Transcript_5709/g.13446  ORF Transcript_5709/g.13446 Transcript_5709/m.13446 type:complete len:205 (-) Transcript_5709:3527-4141(-)
MMLFIPLLVIFAAFHLLIIIFLSTLLLCFGRRVQDNPSELGPIVLRGGLDSIFQTNPFIVVVNWALQYPYQEKIRRLPNLLWCSIEVNHLKHGSNSGSSCKHHHWLGTRIGVNRMKRYRVDTGTKDWYSLSDFPRHASSCDLATWTKADKKLQKLLLIFQVKAVVFQHWTVFRIDRGIVRFKGCSPRICDPEFVSRAWYNNAIF